MTLFAPFAEVPFYPLVFPLFWGAVLVFGLAMARHLRVFAAARATGPSPFADIPTRFVGLVRYAFVQTRMFQDPRAGLLHAGIFWGFVLLTIGTANIVTGGLIEQVLSHPVRRAAVDPHQCDAERRRGARPRVDRVGLRAPAHHQAEAADVQHRCPDHPVDDRRGRPDRAAGGGLRVRRARRPAGRLRVGRPGGPVAGRSVARGPAGRLRGPVVGAHRARGGVPRLPAVQQAPPHRHELSRTSGSASSARAASCRRWTSRTRPPRSGSRRSRTSAGRTCSTASRAPNAVAARRPARPTSPGSRSTPRPSSWASGTCRSMPSTGSTSSPTARSCARPTASTTPGPTRQRWPSRSWTRPSRTTRCGTA